MTDPGADIRYTEDRLRVRAADGLLSRITKSVLVALAALAIAAATSPATSQETTEKLTPEEASKQLTREQQDLLITKERATGLELSLEDLAAARAELNERLVATAALIKEKEASLTTIEETIGKLDADSAELRQKLLGQQATIGKLLGVLQRMGRNPPPVVITSRDDALGMVRSAVMLASVFPELRDQAQSLAVDLEKFDSVIRAQKLEADRLKAETAALTDGQRQLDQLLLAKRSELAANEEDLADMRSAVAAQEKRVASLTELIDQLGNSVGKEGDIGKYDQQLIAGNAPGQVEPASDGYGVGETERRFALLKPSSRVEPALPFANAKGLLPLPIAGKRILNFGQETKLGSKSKGIAIKARADAQVTSPCDGWIVFAREFRSYGQLLIINAGGGYHVMLAGMAEINVTEGQFVLSGEPIGRMGSKGGPSAGDKTREAKDGAPVLYVEFRNKERAFNPDPWWGEGSDKVQG